MKVSVRLFARARDLAGRDALAVDLPPASTVEALRRELAVRCPALASLVPRCAVAVNGQFAVDAQSLPEDAEVALLPPVSGGAYRPTSSGMAMI